MGLYLDEALLGLRGGDGDKSETHSGAKPMFGLAHRWRGLQHIVNLSNVAENVCGALFWISMGAVFGRVLGAGLLVQFRSQFAENWYSLMLATRRHMTGDLPVDREARDWVVEAWPFIFSQVVFRVFFDAFKEDRDNFSTQGASLLAKLTQVAHYEATGFKLDPGTGVKARRRLFLKRVIKMPEQNQHEFLKGFSRQKAMETAKDSAGNVPLSFAQSLKDGGALQEAQLSDVWENRIKEEHQPTQRWDRPGLLTATLAKEEPQGVRQESSKLSTDLLAAQSKWAQKHGELTALRYQNLSAEGDCMINSHQAELAELCDELDEDNILDHSPVSVLSSPPTTPLLTRANTEGPAQAWSGPSSRSALRSQGGAMQGLGVSFQERSHRAEVAGSLRGETNEARFASFQEGSVQPDMGLDSDTSAPELSPPSRWRKSKVMKTVAGVISVKERREKQEKERAARQKALATKIAKEALPKDISSKELVTTWVSPATQHLCPDADDRLLLRKPAAQGFQLKMQVARPSLSMPNLRAATPTNEGSPTSTGNRMLASRGGSRGAGRLLASESDFASASGSPRGIPLSLSLPRVGSAKVQLRNGEEKVSLEGHPGIASQGQQSPSNLSSTMILQRMTEQSQAFHKGTFSEYMKDFNILTGEHKKYKIDKDELRAEEDLTLRVSQQILGGRAQRMNPLSKLIDVRLGL